MKSGDDAENGRCIACHASKIEEAFFTPDAEKLLFARHKFLSNGTVEYVRYYFKTQPGDDMCRYLRGLPVSTNRNAHVIKNVPLGEWFSLMRKRLASPAK